MAIFTSNLMDNGALAVQAGGEGVHGSVTARVFIPAGTILTDGDFIKFCRVFPNISITKIMVRSADLDGGGSPALAAQLGYMRAVRDPRKALDSGTNPAVTGAIGADSTAYFAAAGASAIQAGGVVTLVSGQSGLDNEFANTGVIAGYADIAYEITTTANGASAADGYIDVTLEYTGLNRVPGEFAGANAYDYKDPAAAV